MQTKRIVLKAGEIFFYIYWFLMSFAKGMGWYEGMVEYNICLLISFVCICIKLLLEERTVLEWVLIGSLVSLGSAVYLSSGEKMPLIYIFLVIGMKNVSVVRTFKLGLAVWSFCFLYRALLEITGISQGLVLAHEKLGMDAVLRYAFGYPHPNVMHITYAVLVAFILFLTARQGKDLIKLAVLLFVGNLYVFLYSISYTGFILTTLCICIFCYLLSRRSLTQFEKVCIQMVLPFCVFFSIAGPLLTGEGSVLEKYGSVLNKVFNSRFGASRMYLNQGFALFGKRCEISGFALDCSYVSLLVKDGLVFFLLIITSYLILVRFYLRNGERKRLALILAFFVAGISEPFLFNTSFKNLSFVFLGESFYLCMKKVSVKKKQWCILPKCMKNRRWSFAYPEEAVQTLFDSIRMIWKNKKKKIVLLGVAGAVVTASIWLYSFPKYESIYVEIRSTDCAPREPVFLESGSLADHFNSLIIGYQDADSPMYVFDGAILIFERIRTATSWGIIGGTAAVVAVFVFYKMT